MFGYRELVFCFRPVKSFRRPKTAPLVGIADQFAEEKFFSRCNRLPAWDELSAKSARCGVSGGNRLRRSARPFIDVWTIYAYVANRP